jgi:serine/threonine protein phosphatase 1
MKSYAIGDIHGHLDRLIAAHELIAADMAQTGPAPVVHVGDLVDRGPDCRGVIDFLIAGQNDGRDWITLKGNHDRLFTRFLNAPLDHDDRMRREYSWLHPRIGGAATLASYGVANAGDRPIAPVHAEALDRVPAAHRRFLETLPTAHQIGGLIFVHAGIRPGRALADQTEGDLLWIRDEFLNDPRDHGALVIHGHTVVETATHYGNRVNIDTGAAYGGPLTAVVIEGRDVAVLTRDGRKPLRPAQISPQF